MKQTLLLVEDDKNLADGLLVSPNLPSMSRDDAKSAVNAFKPKPPATTDPSCNALDFTES